MGVMNWAGRGTIPVGNSKGRGKPIKRRYGPSRGPYRG